MDMYFQRALREGHPSSVTQIIEDLDHLLVHKSQNLKIQRAALCCTDSSKLISLAMYEDQTAQVHSKKGMVWYTKEDKITSLQLLW